MDVCGLIALASVANTGQRGGVGALGRSTRAAALVRPAVCEREVGKRRKQAEARSGSQAKSESQAERKRSLRTRQSRPVQSDVMTDAGVAAMVAASAVAAHAAVGSAVTAAMKRKRGPTMTERGVQDGPIASEAQLRAVLNETPRSRSEAQSVASESGEGAAVDRAEGEDATAEHCRAGGSPDGVGEQDRHSAHATRHAAGAGGNGRAVRGAAAQRVSCRRCRR
eukprot:879258-Prymnesium_polylepis.2